MMNETKEEIIRQIRKNVFLNSYISGSGHLGSSLSCVELLYALYAEGGADISPERMSDPDRDKVILSKGHGSLALYQILAETGYMTKEETVTFAGRDSKLGGEPNRNELPFVETTTGALGHGLPVATGIALADKLDGRDAKTFVIVGDGELQEGSMWEAVMTAKRYELDHLILLLDQNRLQKMGGVEEISGITTYGEKFLSFGWDVTEVADGHDVDQILDALRRISYQGKPHAVITHTIKGKGVSLAENNALWHFKQPRKKELKVILPELQITEEEIEHAKCLREQTLGTA